MALVLTRGISESIVINDNIRIEINDIYEKTYNKYVKLAFHCPRNVSIHREEIFNTLRKENKSLNIIVNKNDAFRKVIEGYMVYDSKEIPCDTWLDKCIERSAFNVYFNSDTIPNVSNLESIYGKNFGLAKVKITAEVEYL